MFLTCTDLLLMMAGCPLELELAIAQKVLASLTSCVAILSDKQSPRKFHRADNAKHSQKRLQKLRELL